MTRLPVFRHLKREVQRAWKIVGEAEAALSQTVKMVLEENAVTQERALMHYTSNRILKYLYLNNNHFSIDGMAIIGEARGVFQGLRHIDIGSNDFTGNAYNRVSEGALLLTNSIRAAKLVTHLDVSDNGLHVGGDSAVLNMLCQALYGLTHIVYLNLASNAIGLKGSRMLAGALNALKHIKELNLSDNDMTSEGIKTIVPAMRPSLLVIDLSSNDIGPDGVSALSVALQGLTQLQKIDLSDNHLMHAFSHAAHHDDEEEEAVGGAGLLMKAFGGKSAQVSMEKGRKKTHGRLKDVASKMMIAGGELRKLALMGPDDNTGTIKRGFPLFANSVAMYLPHIETISISMSLAAGTLRSNGPSLDFSNARLGCEELIIAGELLKFNTRLTMLNLSGNDMTWGGGDLQACDTMAGWIAEAKHLKHINLTKVFLWDAGMMRIAKGLCANTNLEEILLGDNKIGSAGALALSQGVANLTNLRVLNLAKNPLISIDARDPIYQVIF